MPSVINNKQIPFGIVLLEEVTGHTGKLNLRSVFRDEPDLSVKAVQILKHIAEPVQFLFHKEFVLFPTYKAHVDGLISGASSIRESLIGGLDLSMCVAVAETVDGIHLEGCPQTTQGRSYGVRNGMYHAYTMWESVGLVVYCQTPPD